MYKGHAGITGWRMAYMWPEILGIDVSNDVFWLSDAESVSVEMEVTDVNMEMIYSLSKTWSVASINDI